jgi:hypothetical protein
MRYKNLILAVMLCMLTLSACSTIKIADPDLPPVPASLSQPPVQQDFIVPTLQDFGVSSVASTKPSYKQIN